MGQRSRDDKAEPSLELPSLPGFGRRKKTRRDRRATGGDVPATEPPRPGAQSADTPEPEPEEHAEATLTLSENGLSENGLSENGAPRRRAEKRQRPERARGPESRKTRTTPLVPGRLAALLTGIAVGAAGAAGTYGAMAGCKVVRGVSTCGGAPGFFILVAILVLMVLLGTGVLTLLGVRDAGSTSFLAVGLVAVVAMLVLLEVIFSVWMFAVIPAVSGVAFLLAHWVTTRFADEDKGRRDWT